MLVRRKLSAGWLAIDSSRPKLKQPFSLIIESEPIDLASLLFTKTGRVESIA